MHLTIPSSLRDVIYSETDPPSGMWCCLGCHRHYGPDIAEDEHVRRCKGVKRLIDRRRHLLARREARDAD